MRIAKLNQIFAVVTAAACLAMTLPAALRFRTDRGVLRPLSQTNEATNTTIAHIGRGGFDMFRGILTLTLSLCLGAAAAPAALAQAVSPITEQEARAI